MTFEVVSTQSEVKKMRKYRVLNKGIDYQNFSSALTVLKRADATMTKPLMFHFISEFDINLFTTDRFIQTFKEKFESEVGKRNKQRKKADPTLRERSIPEIEMIYSVESKELKDGSGIYNHIHMMIIIDAQANRYGADELIIICNKALSRIKGLQQVHYDDGSVVGVKDNKNNYYGLLKPRDPESTVKATEKYLSILCHDLKQEFNDAVIRASYICKNDQKELLPEKYQKVNFNVTRVKRSANDNDGQQVA